METNERVDFAKVLGTVAEAYSKELSDGLVETYFQQLQRFSLSQVQRAAGACLNRSKFWPTIADFVEAIEGAPGDKALAAFNLACKALSKISGDGSILIEDDPAMVKAIQQTFGDWIGFSDGYGRLDFTDPMAANLAKTFQRNYNSALKECLPAKPHHFVGRHEAHNRIEHSRFGDGKTMLGQSAGRICGGRFERVEAKCASDGRLLIPASRGELGPAPKETERGRLSA